MPTLKQYVVALYESLKDEKKIDQINQRIFNFARILKKNNHLKLKNKIILEFEKYWKEKNGIIDVLVKNIKPLEEAQKKQLINWIITHSSRLVNKKINPAPFCEVLNSTEKISSAIHPRNRATKYSERCWIKEIKIKEKIDKNLINGMILKIGDLIIDSSIKKQLEKLKEALK